MSPKTLKMGIRKLEETTRDLYRKRQHLREASKT